MSNSLGLVDFASGLLNAVRNLPDGQVKFFGENLSYRGTVIKLAGQELFFFLEGGEGEGMGVSQNDFQATTC